MHILIATSGTEEIGTFKVNYIPRKDETIIIKGKSYIVEGIIYTLDEAKSIILNLKGE